MRFDPGTGQHPTAIVVRTARPAGNWDRRVGEQQVAWARGVLVSGVLESGAVAHLLIEADPVFKATLADLEQPARHSERTGFRSRPEHPRRAPHGRARIETVPIAWGKFPRHAGRPAAPLLAPVREAIGFANMVDCQGCDCYRSFNCCGTGPR